MRTTRRDGFGSTLRLWLDTAQDTVRSFSASGRALFLFLSGLLVVSTVALLYLLNASLLVTIPAHGGSLTEGLIGAPRFINPVLAISDSDRDLTSLVYSGLLRATPSGDYIPDLASNYTLSPDGKTYTFTLRPNATFQDGTPVTADDVVFTIAETQDPVIKSPERANWSGVQVTKVDAHTVQFTLSQAYAPFIENLTLGILPKHLWQGVGDDEMSFSTLNSQPVGSGPFAVTSVSRTASGIPSTYQLSSFSRYALGAPYLDHLVFRFYQNEGEVVQALKSGEIESAGGISATAVHELDGFTIQRAPLSRVFGVFFNQNQSEVLRDATVRQALNSAIDQDDLVATVLSGYGAPLTGPIPPSTLANTSHTLATSSAAQLAQAAKQTLLNAGWQPGPDGYLQKTIGTGKNAKTIELAFSLATGDVPELRSTAEYVRAAWQKVGAKVTVQVYNQGDLSQNVIRTRNYDALLFGEVVGRELDLFAFWDSSQRVDPGLNIAQYANASADKLLEQLRQTSDPATRATLFTQFSAAVAKDVPAVFLYTPDFVYSVPNDLKGLSLGLIETPDDRFLSVYQWYRETDHVWPFFEERQR